MKKRIRSFSNRVMRSIFDILKYTDVDKKFSDRMYVNITLRVCRYENDDVGHVYCVSSVSGEKAKVGWKDPNRHRDQRGLRKIGWKYDSNRMINNHQLMKVPTPEISDRFEECLPFIRDVLSAHFQKEVIMNYKCSEERLEGTGQDFPFD